MLFSPMEQFEIYKLFDFQFQVTNLNFYLQVVTFQMVLIPFYLNNKVVSNAWGIVNESQYKTLQDTVVLYISPKHVYYLPLIYTLFMFVFFCNLTGMVPYSATPTVEIVLTLSQAFTIQMGVLLNGFMQHGLKVFSLFLPAGTPQGLILLMIPLEVLAYVTRTFSLGLRLAVNLITGHIQAKVSVGFIWQGFTQKVSIFVLLIPLAQVTLFLALEQLIAYLQAYIFTFIICITIRDVLA